MAIPRQLVIPAPLPPMTGPRYVKPAVKRGDDIQVLRGDQLVHIRVAGVDAGQPLVSAMEARRFPWAIAWDHALGLWRFLDGKDQPTQH